MTGDDDVVDPEEIEREKDALFLLRESNVLRRVREAAPKLEALCRSAVYAGLPVGWKSRVEWNDTVNDWALILTSPAFASAPEGGDVDAFIVIEGDSGGAGLRSRWETWTDGSGHTDTPTAAIHAAISHLRCETRGEEG